VEAGGEPLDFDNTMSKKYLSLSIPEPWFAAGVAAFLAVCSGMSANAQPQPQPDGAGGKPGAGSERATRVTVTSVAGSLIPGETNLIGLTFRIEAGWHMYWDGHNDSGSAPEFTMTLPAGWSQGKTKWPVPKRQMLPGDIVDYVYEGEVTLLVPLEVPAAAAGSDVEIPIRLKWLVCSDVCVPEKGSTTLKALVALSNAPTVEGVEQPRRISETLHRRLPKPIAEATGIKVTAGAGFLRIEAEGAKIIRFMPSVLGVALLDAAAEGEVKGGVLAAGLDEADAEHPGVAGIIEVVGPKGREAYWFEKSLASAAASDGNPEGGSPAPK